MSTSSAAPRGFARFHDLFRIVDRVSDSEIWYGEENLFTVPCS